MAKGQIGLGFSTPERQEKRNEGGLRRAGKERRGGRDASPAE